MRARCKEGFEAICGFPPRAPPLAAVASLKGVKSGSEIDRLAQPNSIDGLSHNTWQVGERQNSVILNVYTTVTCSASVLGHTCVCQPLLHPEIT